MDIKVPPVQVNEGVSIQIKATGKKVPVLLNDKIVVEHTEPEKAPRPKGMEQRLIDKGTFALQAHDTKSKVYYKNIRVKGW